MATYEEEREGFNGTYVETYQEYICVMCGERVDTLSDEDKKELQAESQLMEILGK